MLIAYLLGVLTPTLIKYSIQDMVWLLSFSGVDAEMWYNTHIRIAIALALLSLFYCTKTLVFY